MICRDNQDASSGKIVAYLGFDATGKRVYLFLSKSCWLDGYQGFKSRLKSPSHGKRP